MLLAPFRGKQRVSEPTIHRQNASLLYLLAPPSFPAITSNTISIQIVATLEAYSPLPLRYTHLLPSVHVSYRRLLPLTLCSSPSGAVSWLEAYDAWLLLLCHVHWLLHRLRLGWLLPTLWSGHSALPLHHVHCPHGLQCQTHGVDGNVEMHLVSTSRNRLTL